jgi:hypothetical protein
MPTVEFDISDKVANLIDTGIKSGGPGDFNPGQQSAWAAVECTINTATLTVRIAGQDVDVETNIDVSCTGASYISEAVAELQEAANSMGESVADIIDTKSYIDEAFKSL